MKAKKPLNFFRGFWYDLVALSDSISNNLHKDYEQFLMFYEAKKTSKEV
jgi:hypothetical protein